MIKFLFIVLLAITGKILASFIVLLLSAFVLGVVRLFVWGWTQRYERSLKDATSLKKGDVILTGKQSVFYSWQIQVSNVLTRKLKHRFWTHAAIYQGNGKVWEAQPEGIIEKEIDHYFKSGYLVRAFRHKYITDKQILEKVLQFCAEKKGYQFGTLGTIFYTLSTFVPISFNWLFDNPLIDRLLNLDNAYYCSELIVDAFKEVGYPVSSYDGWRVKPADFIGNPLFVDVV